MVAYLAFLDMLQPNVPFSLAKLRRYSFFPPSSAERGTPSVVSSAKMWTLVGQSPKPPPLTEFVRSLYG